MICMLMSVIVTGIKDDILKIIILHNEELKCRSDNMYSLLLNLHLTSVQNRGVGLECFDFLPRRSAEQQRSTLLSLHYYYYYYYIMNKVATRPVFLPGCPVF